MTVFLKRALTFCSLVFFMSSCTPNANRHAKVLSVNFSRQPLTIDPRYTGDLISSTLEFMYLEGLTRMDGSSTTTPALAEKIILSEDRSTYTFFLRKAFWSDGTPIRAADFVRSWQKSLDPAKPSLSAQLLYPIKNAEKIAKGELPLSELGAVAERDDLLVVELEHETPYFLELTSFCTLFPAPPIEGDLDQFVSQHPTKLLASGPFRFKSYNVLYEIVLEKNPFYWDKEHVYLDEIRISMVLDDRTALQMYEKGDLDILGLAFSEIPRDAIAHLQKENRLKTHPISATSFCQFNTAVFPFSNKNIRLAFSLAINRKQIMDHLYLLGDTVAKSVVPPLLTGGFSQTLIEDQNKEKARDYLAMGLEELGCSAADLGTIPYLYFNSEVNRRIAEVIQDQVLDVLGLPMKLEGYDFKVFLSAVRQKNFHMAQKQWIAQFNDPISMLGRYRSSKETTNDTLWDSEPFRDLLEKSDFIQNPAERLSLLGKAEKIFASDLPITPLYHWYYAYLHKEEIKGIYISPIGSIHLNCVKMD